MSSPPADQTDGEVGDLFGVDVPNDARREPFFFLTHGAGGDLSSRGLVAMSSILSGRGHLSVRTNLAYRAAGRKSPPAAEKSVQGFVEAFRRAQSQHGAGARWVVGGRSYGGRVASLAVAQGLKVAGLICFPYPLHRPGDPAHPRVEHWPLIEVPCLFVQGTKDPFCDVDVLQEVIPTLGAKPTLLLVEGGDHSLKVGKKAGSSPQPRAEEVVLRDLLGDIASWIETLPLGR